MRKSKCNNCGGDMAVVIDGYGTPTGEFKRTLCPVCDGLPKKPEPLILY